MPAAPGKPRISRRRVLASAAAGLSLLLPGCTRQRKQSDGVYTLRVADGFTMLHPVNELITRPFMAKATAMSDGRLRFEHFPSEQLGKLRDMLRLTRWGMMDMAYITPAFNSEKLPTSSVHDLPNALGDDIARGVKVLEYLYRDGGLLRETELAPNGVRPVLYVSTAPAQLGLATSRRIETLSDLQGLKLRIASPATEVLVRSLGATPIRMATGELFEALIRGTVDGLMMAATSATAYDIASLFTQVTNGLNFGAISGAYSIREQTWRRLPKDLQEIIIEAGLEASEEGCAAIQALEAKAMQEVLNLGVRPIALTAADRLELDHHINGVYTRWAERMTRIGRPGDEALRELARAKAMAGI